MAIKEKGLAIGQPLISNELVFTYFSPADHEHQDGRSNNSETSPVVSCYAAPHDIRGSQGFYRAVDDT